MAYALPTSAPLTDGSGSSSSPGLLPTPTCQLQHDSQTHRSGARSGELLLGGVALSLLPTPTVSDTNGAGAHGTGGPDLRTAVSLLPTPRATDGTKGGPNQRGSSGDLMLPSAVMLLPTPVATDAKGTRNATSGRQEGSQHHSGTTLTDALMLLPTPSVADALGGHLSRSGSRSTELLLPGVAKALASGGLTSPPSDAGSD